MAYCDRCQRSFPNDRALEQHEEDSNAHWACDDCDLDFESSEARRQHYIQSSNHPSCSDCDRHFNSKESRIQHMAAKHWYCRAHDKMFKSEDGLQSHYKQSPNHHFCEGCDRDFDDEDELWEHAEKEHHACRMCQELFDSYEELQDHDRDEHYYCTDCREDFQNSSNLRHHLRTQHMAAGQWYCQAHDRAFKSEDALQSHYRYSSSHHFCTDCESDFDDEDDLWEHAEENHLACRECRERFDSYEELQEHDSDVHNYCTNCEKGFQSPSSLRNHQSSKHPEPATLLWLAYGCNRAFALHAVEARIQHMAAKHPYCRVNDRVFKSEDGLQSHYKQSLDHHFCKECESDFDNEDDLWDHIEEDHHACRECHELFDSYSELQEHDRDQHDYCTDCKRVFESPSHLRHHLSSKLHQPATVLCPGRGCERAFVSHGALMLHVESGTCPSRMTREKLNRLVVRADQGNYITNPNRLLTGPLGHFEPPATKVTWATERSWNGEAYECFLCNSKFKTLARLNTHLQSPRHEDKIYRCPKPDCRTEFVTLSGLCQHVEGGSCGVRMFKRVRDAMESLTKGFNALTV